MAVVVRPGNAGLTDDGRPTSASSPPSVSCACPPQPRGGTPRRPGCLHSVIPVVWFHSNGEGVCLKNTDKHTRRVCEVCACSNFLPQAHSGKESQFSEKETYFKDALYVDIVWDHNSNPYAGDV